MFSIRWLRVVSLPIAAPPASLRFQPAPPFPLKPPSRALLDLCRCKQFIYQSHKRTAHAAPYLDGHT